MAKTIVIDPGHGGSDPGAVYRTFKEKDFNLKIALKARDFLTNNYTVNVEMTRTGDATLSLQDRTNHANRLKADYFISIHQNSGGGDGFESYIYSGTSSAATTTFRDVIHNEVMKKIASYHVKDRGKKKANYFVLRETSMPASLIEVLFIDNSENVKLLQNDNFINQVAIGLAEGIAKALNLPKIVKESPKNQPNTTPVKTPTPSPQPSQLVYRVIAGSFSEKSNAQQRVKELQSEKISSFIDVVNLQGKIFYRVQAGAFGSREYALKRIELLQKFGIKNAFIDTHAPGATTPPPDSIIAPQPQPKPGTPSTSGQTISGLPLLSGKLLDDFVQRVNPNAPKVGADYIHFGSAYGIRGDIAFAQAIHETGFFQFKGQVKLEQNNFAGLGSGKATFATPSEGALAHIQHLYAYASSSPPPMQYPIVDPRFQHVPRASARLWTDLNGKWAIPGTNYGQTILKIYQQMIRYSIDQLSKEL